ncbi:putative holliday junction resolvase [Rubritalea squalenifaciens DSM 18772]|uniref:Putative pre-16S rRNA nuclease n=1 Tax=Rubritalea squalenifaciens DSM 18772 TaxID=1123071 RepID=A0A1M6P0A2_9BACT|nr:Holliday junction resolvase RuvX [Rubritalea squalenifaciens]SHK01346.1 putative holliday junction resolvase [Rubritalea squalenifaciens DSM 18772]
MHAEDQHPVLGIDHGEARIGLAITDSLGILAHPLETIQCQTTPAIPRIIELIRQRSIKQIVIGLPLRMDGSEGTAAEKIRTFAEELREALPAPLPLHFIDERLTTVAASEKLRSAGKNTKKQKQIIDQAAAVEILSDWLDQQLPPAF